MILRHLSPEKVEHIKLLWLFSWVFTNTLDGPASWCELDRSESIFYVLCQEEKKTPSPDKGSHILVVVRFGLQMLQATCQ